MEKLIKDREEIVRHMQKGAAVRARKNWMEFGKKNSKMFFSLEKRNYTQKNRQQLLNKHGEIVTDNAKILQVQYEFYKQLFTSRGTIVPKGYLDNIEFPQIQEWDQIELANPITEEEVKNALFDMNFNKVPGSQGLLPEWYVKFWEDIKAILFNVITEASQKGFSCMTGQGVISLMEKPDKNPLQIESWRPLSLLNTDFKLLSKILANRIKKV